MADRIIAAEHPDVHHWLVTHTETSSFARSLLKRLHEKGSLTDPQIARVQHMVDAERARHRRHQRRADGIKRMIRNFP